MKTFLPALITVYFVFISSAAFAQLCGNTASGTLEANRVKAHFSTLGDMFNQQGGDAGFAVPYTPGLPETHTLFTSGLILAGMDGSGQLRVSFVGYRYDNSITDYNSGPLDDITGEPLENGCADFDQIWRVDRYDIISLLEDYEDNGTIDNPIPENILKWPGRGNAFFTSLMGFELPDQDLAPFFDRNNNGIYEPDNGEHPIIGDDLIDVQPDQLLWVVFNDVGHDHPNIQSPSLGAEVQLTAYGFNCTDDEVLSHTIFTRHKIILKGTTPIDSMMVGIFSDPDLGCFEDDYLGYDTTLNTMYIYNRDNIDGSNSSFCPAGINTFAENPPVQAITLLNDNMHRGLFFNNGSIGVPPPGTTDPQMALEIHHFLNGFWRDGTPMTFGGDGYNPGSNDVVNFLFFDNPNDPDGWSMFNEGGTNFDRRSIFSTPPRPMQQGESLVMDIAYSYHREPGANNLENVNVMLQQVAGIQGQYDNDFETLCTQTVYCEADCVWPGDADHSGRVDKDDVLAIGVGAGHSANGANRNPANYNWAPQLADLWNDNFIDGTNYKHADCNGDGNITPIDESITEINYDFTVDGFVAPDDVTVEPAEVNLCLEHNRDELSTTGSSLQRLLRTEIHLGTADNPVEGLYGIAFTVLYDTALMEPAFNFPLIRSAFSAFLGDEPQNISISVAKPERGRLDFSVSRTDGQEVSGFGQLAEIWLQLRGDAATGNQDGTRNVVYQVVNLKAIDFDENLLDIGAKSDTTLATDLIFDPTITSTRAVKLNKELRLSPNPNQGLLQIDLSDVKNTRMNFSLYNLQGKILVERKLQLVDGSTQVQLPVQIRDGIYIVRLIDANGSSFSQKLIVGK